MSSIADLIEASATFEDPLAVVRLAAGALVDACPRAMGGAFVFADWPARRLLVTGAAVAAGALPEIERRYADAFPQTYLGWHRARPAPVSRDQWLEPIERRVTTPDAFRQSEGYRAAFAPLGLFHHARRLYCAGPRPVAYACACLPEDGPRFSDRETAALDAVAERLAPVLRLTAAAGSVDRGAALDHLLADRADPCFVVSPAGALLGASAAGERLIRRDPDVLAAARDAVRSVGGRAQAVQVNGRTLHVTPCSERGASTAWLVLAEPTSDGAHRHRLTPRQSELLDLLAQGLTNAEVADALGVRPGTVKTMLERLYRRAGVRTRGALVRWAAT
ncbi:MAG: LuxR C-terminal-related transcriptional regulator [Myxococcota bacterium]